MRTLVWALSIVVLTAVVWTRFDVTTDIGTMLSTDEAKEEMWIAQQIASGKLARNVIISIETSESADVTAASRAFEHALRADPGFGSHFVRLVGGPSDGTDEAVWSLYQPRRFAFTARTVAEARAATSSESLESSAERLRHRLTQPMSALISRVAPADPLLILPRFFENIQASQAGKVNVRDGRFVSSDGRHALVFLTTRAAAFDANGQEAAYHAIEEAIDEVASVTGDAPKVEVSGVGKFAIAARHAIERDIRRVTTVSSIALTLLMLIFFRSLRIAPIVAAPILTGVLAGAAFVLLTSGRIHGLTLAFGASLIGVAVDYVMHVYGHFQLSPNGRSGEDAAANVQKSVLLGAGTTLAGFVALSIFSPGALREAAQFAIVGLLAALATSLLVVPGWMGSNATPTRTSERFAYKMAHAIRSLSEHRGVGLALLFGAALIVAAVAPFASWSDSFAELGQVDSSLADEEEAVRERVAQFDQSRFVLARASSLEKALEINDRVADALSGELGDASYRSLATFLPSAERQIAVYEAFTSSEDLKPRFRRVFEAAGFQIETFAPFFESVDAPAPDPLAWKDLLASPLAPLVDMHVTEIGEGFGVLTFLRDTRTERVEDVLKDVDGALVIDQNRVVRDATNVFMQRTIRGLIIGLVLIVLVLAVRYRRPRAVLATLLPAILAAGLTVAVLTVLGQPIDLVVLTGLMMVVCMGVDYCVFLYDSLNLGGEHAESSLAASALSVFIAGISTLVGFGVLALSAYPVLFRIGITAAVGIASAMLLAPIATTLLGVPNDGGHE